MSAGLRSDASPRAIQPQPYRVMVVDDSAVIRGLMTRWMSEDSDIHVVGSASNGAMALKQVERLDPEVLILDIEMPEMDGLTALPKLLEILPDLKVVMASTLTLRNADVSLRALAAGAADYVPKPSSTREINSSEIFRAELLAKVKALGAARRLRPNRRLAVQSGASPAHQAKPLAAQPPKITLRAASRMPVRALAIGSSTGGPQALFQLFGKLKNRLSTPVLITQHMPPTFTTILADHLSRISGTECREAVDGEPVLPGRIYVAPGDWHMTVAEEGGRKFIRLNQFAHENFCRPAVDPMMRSLAQAYGGSLLAIILTGMGSDGMRGCRDVVGAGGTVLAQDEASSIVWGMPGAVATAGLCSSVLPLNDIAPAIERMTLGVAA